MSTVSSVFLAYKLVLVCHSVLLKNFLDALKISNSIPKHLLLQTGAKHYGVHIGPTLTPMEEDDPRYLRQGHFYFDQEDLLWSWCAQHNVEWNVTRPSFIIGAVKDAQLTYFTTSLSTHPYRKRWVPSSNSRLIFWHGRPRNISAPRR